MQNMANVYDFITDELKMHLNRELEYIPGCTDM